MSDYCLKALGVTLDLDKEANVSHYKDNLFHDIAMVRITGP